MEIEMSSLLDLLSQKCGALTLVNKIGELEKKVVALN